jgi:hypothetical protein
MRAHELYDLQESSRSCLNQQQRTESCWQSPQLRPATPRLHSHKWVPGRCESCGEKYLREPGKKSVYFFCEADARQTNSGLEVGNFLISHCIRFGDDGNEVDACVQTRHELYVNGSKTSRTISTNEMNSCHGNLRVTRWLNEVQACMDTIVNNFLTVDLVLVFQILVKSRLYILDNWSPAEEVSQKKMRVGWEEHNANLSSLLTKSPKPGVSTTVKRRRTPFSSISVVLQFSGQIGRASPEWKTNLR